MLREGLLSEAEWSDEEDTAEKYLVKSLHDQPDDDDSLDSFQRNEKPEPLDSSVIGLNRLVDHKRSRFSGYITVDRNRRAEASVASQKLLTPVALHPSVPSDVLETVGSRLLSKVWREFLRYGADEAEMILVGDVRRMFAENSEFAELPISGVAPFRSMEANDFIEFTTLAKELAKFCNQNDNRSTSHPSTDICRVCCSMGACRHGVPGETGLGPSTRPSSATCASSGEAHSDREPRLGTVVGVEEHRLNVVYSEIKHQLNGKLRVNQVAQVLAKLAIPFDKKRLPRSFWVHRGEFLVQSLAELKGLIAQLRTDEEQGADPMAGMFKYVLPQWLREEFKASEIMLYEHHFAMIDRDGGGSIDADELQALVTAFGSNISREDARRMLEAYDMDGTGTIDFTEFMVLIYKIQRGTIDLSSNDLAQSLVEAKAQLHIFEEIEEVRRDPPACCAVAHFGGNPVACVFHIDGPPGSPYEGLRVALQITFHDGYPFRQPDVVLRGRLMGLHVLPTLAGDSRLMHIKQLWSAEWSMRRLLVHVVDILARPDPELLPDNLYEIYSAWEQALPEARSALRSKQPAVAKVMAGGADGANRLLRKGVRGISGQPGSKLETPPQSARIGGAAEAKAGPLSLSLSLSPIDSDAKCSGRASSRDGGPCSEAKDVGGESLQDREVARALIVERLAPSQGSIGLDALSDEATQRRIGALSRIERMHLPTMLMHLLDPAEYHAKVQQFMRANYRAVDG